MENSFYPFIDFLANTNINIPNNKPLPLYREIAWDFQNDTPLVVNNEFKIVEMNEAISVWIYHAIKTCRYAFSIYSWDFGCEIDTLLGQNYTAAHTKSEVTRYITEALEINPYILTIDKITVDFDGDVLSVGVRVITVYEELEVNFVV
jgi:hypothetical protein